MPRRCSLLCFAVGLLLLPSCQRALQYPAISKDTPKQKEADADEVPYRLGWSEPSERRDLPIVFVPDTSAEWQQLPAFWTHWPPIPLHLGLPPLPAITAIALADQHQAIKIKVPRGLPDPTPHIPTNNPPTYGRWRLGKQLFFERKLKAGADTYACASCHKPDLGFADGRDRPLDGAYNTLSLVNVVYNRQQFWDGRVQTLEETLVRSLEDERTVDDVRQRDKALKQHIWGGFVRTLVQEKKYDNDFELIFGVDHPSQDTVAKALATYMRTILSGHSLFDRADQFRRDKKAPALTAEHFKAVLKDEHEQSLLDKYSTAPNRDEMPAMLAKGYELFRGKARCAQCHTGPLFTDQDYHNVGYHDAREGSPPIGQETGRSVHVPIGQKEMRLVGAFRTPSLRNLARTRPYFHDGSMPTLPSVLDFYGRSVRLNVSYLAKELRADEREQQLRLSADEMDALVMFLRSLEGTPVAPIVSGAAK